MEFKRVTLGLTLVSFLGAAMLFAILRKILGGPKKGRGTTMISDVELAQMLRKDRYKGK